MFRFWIPLNPSSLMIKFFFGLNQLKLDCCALQPRALTNIRTWSYFSLANLEFLNHFAF